MAHESTFSLARREFGRLKRMADGAIGQTADDDYFALLAADTRDALTDAWETGWRLLFDALEPLDDSSLGETVTIRGETLTVWQAVNRQLTHYAYHTGQLVLLAKHFAGARWQTLSVAKGGSSAFNRNPSRYLDEADA